MVNELKSISATGPGLTTFEPPDSFYGTKVKLQSQVNPSKIGMVGTIVDAENFRRMA